jgi:hypothetical protein
MLVATIVIAEVLHILLFTRSNIWSLLPALVIILSLSALYGYRWLIVTTKYLLYFQGVTILISLAAPRPISVLLVSARTAWAVLYLASARYIGLSTDVANFYAASASQSATELPETKTSSIEKYNQKKKYRIIATIMALLFLIPSMVFKYKGEYYSDLPLNPLILSIILQTVTLPFFVMSYHFAKCPACSKFAGGGWTVSKCKKCGEILS